MKLKNPGSNISHNPIRNRKIVGLDGPQLEVQPPATDIRNQNFVPLDPIPKQAS